MKLRTLACVVGLLGAAVASAADGQVLPKVVDFGDKFCIPCKLMAPTLEELKTEQAGELEVQFVSVGDKENMPLVEKHKIALIPTQIFFDADGKEVWRHEGYISKHGILLKWKELGAELNPFGPTFKRLEAAAKDERPKDNICFMCDGDVNAKSMVTVPTEKGNVNLCSAHHFFVMLSCLQKDLEATEKAATVADAATGQMIPVTTANYLCGMDERTAIPGDAKSPVNIGLRRMSVRNASRLPTNRPSTARKAIGPCFSEVFPNCLSVPVAWDYLNSPGIADERTGRPTVKAFVERGEAENARAVEGGCIVGYSILKPKDLAARCGFCDRSVYPEDVALVAIEGVHSWGCCAHCSMGCAARMSKDIEVHQPDGLTGEPVIVKTMGGYVASIEPKTAVAWFGKRKNAEGKFVSAGCFHQGFFANEENLKIWVQQHPFETGEAITIEQSLRDKMVLSPAQIQKACKVGECSPK